MGFGIGLPGLRISTRGVRVGPRMANVRVGRGGAGVSVGPRIARVSVGTGGVRVGSGLGPLYVSNRGVGVSVGTGLGGAGISNRGVGGFVGPGPFWLGGNLRWPSLRGFLTSGRPTVHSSPHHGSGHASPSGVRYSMPLRHSVTSTRVLFSSTLPNLAAQHAALKSQMVAAGVKRRNKYEIRQAAAEAIFWSCASMVAVLREYHAVQTPAVPPLPTLKEVKREAWRRIFKHHELKLVLRRWKQLLAEEIRAISSELQARRDAMNIDTRKGFERFSRMEPEVLSLVMDCLLSDNLFPARWVINDLDRGLAIVSFGTIDEMIWPEEMKVSKSGGIAVGKMGKDDMHRLHKSLLARAIVSTAVECMAAHPGLSSVRVVAVDGSSQAGLLQRQVWGDCVVTRSDMSRFRPQEGLIQEVVALEEFWNANSGGLDDEQEYLFFNRLLKVWKQLEMTSSSVTANFGKSILVAPSPKGRGIGMRGTLEYLLSDAPSLLAKVRVSQLAEPPHQGEFGKVFDPEFWCAVAQFQ